MFMRSWEVLSKISNFSLNIWFASSHPHFFYSNSSHISLNYLFINQGSKYFNLWGLEISHYFVPTFEDIHVLIIAQWHKTVIILFQCFLSFTFILVINDLKLNRFPIHRFVHSVYEQKQLEMIFLVIDSIKQKLKTNWLLGA